jgi:hypothetical protein
MTAQSSAAGRQSADRSPSRGGVVDGRTIVARRRRELIVVYTAALGGAAALSEGQRIDIRKAAELTALAEQARARAMRQGTTDASEISAMVRLESTASRAVRALALPPPNAGPPVQTLADYIASRHAASDGAEEKACSPPADKPRRRRSRRSRARWTSSRCSTTNGSSSLISEARAGTAGGPC